MAGMSGNTCLLMVKEVERMPIRMGLLSLSFSIWTFSPSVEHHLHSEWAISPWFSVSQSA